MGSFHRILNKHSQRYLIACYHLMSSVSSPCTRAVDCLDRYWQDIEVAYPSTFMKTRDRERPLKLPAKRSITTYRIQNTHAQSNKTVHVSFCQTQRWAMLVVLSKGTALSGFVKTLLCSNYILGGLWCRKQLSVPFAFRLNTGYISWCELFYHATGD